MKKTLSILAATLLTANWFTPSIEAQPPMGGFSGGPGGPGGTPGGSPWGGRGGDRGGMRMEFGGGGGGFDPSSFISRMDRNGNGNIDPDEMEGPARFMLERMARNNPNIDMSKPIPITAITEAMSAFRRDRGEGGGGWGGDSPWGGNGGEESMTLEERVLVPGFGVKKELVPVPGFGSNPFKFNVKVEEQDLRDAGERVQRYDRNRDGTLDANELREGRWGDDPMTFDQNGDGKLTREELAVRSAKRRQNSTANASNQRDNRSQSNNVQQPRQDAEKEKAPNPFEKITSYRMADKDGNPKRPAGLPDWFVRKDIDFDNQVSMKEFATKWTDDVIEDFNRADTNGDGLITTRECLAAVKRGYIPGASGSDSNSSSSSSTSSSSTSGETASGSSSGSASTPTSGGSPADARMREWVAKKIKSFDKNSDGKLDVDELRAYDAKADFTAIDTNKDGLADVEELAAARARK
jgi:Ca2+-binding EF-hand superfamily protein